MRTLMIESVKEGEHEISIELIKSTSDLGILIDLGMNMKALARRGVSEFLTDGGVQYRVTMMKQHSWISWTPDIINGAVIFRGVAGHDS